MITFKCVCPDIDGVVCSSVLKMDTVPEISNSGEEFYGLQIVEFGETSSMVIPEWLAKAIETAINEHEGK